MYKDKDTIGPYLEANESSSRLTPYVFIVQISTSLLSLCRCRKVSLFSRGSRQNFVHISYVFNKSYCIGLQRGVAIRFLKVHETDVLYSGTGKTF
jgi:hypothetical protein